MYRRAYYYLQLYPSAKDSMVANEVPVDFDNFSVRKLLWENVYQNGDAHRRKQGIWWYFQVLAALTGATVLCIGTFHYRSWKYEWADPLVKEEENVLDTVSAEGSLRRLKYKRKVNNW